MALEGGAKLEVTLKSMARKMTSGSVSAGIYDPDIASIAYENEYGTSKIPARPFMRTTFAHHYAEWRDLLADRLGQGSTTSDAMKVVGLAMAGNINQTLIESRALFAPNAKFTIKKKGFDYPLLETGKMFKAVSYRVEKVSR